MFIQHSADIKVCMFSLQGIQYQDKINVRNNVLQNMISMPNSPHYFQLLIFVYILYVFLDFSGFALVPSYMPTASRTYCHMSI